MLNQTRTFIGLISLFLCNIITIQAMAPSTNLDLIQDSKLKNDMALQSLITNICDDSYSKDRITAIELINDKANINLPVIPYGSATPTCISNILLERATRKDDEEMITTLFKHGAGPNLQSATGTPVFFYAKKPETVQKFIEQGVNLNAVKTDNRTNVLRKTLHHKYPAKLFQLYMDQKVNPRNTAYDKSCMFHELAMQCTTYKNKYYDDFSYKTSALLSTCPDMLNTISCNQTPLDGALKILDIEANYTHQMNTYRLQLNKKAKSNARQQAAQSLVHSFRKAGALTAAEIKKNNAPIIKQPVNSKNFPVQGHLMLHDLTTYCGNPEKQIPNDFIKRVANVITSYPDLLHATNDNNETALDIALAIHDNKNPIGNDRRAIMGQLILLYKINGKKQTNQNLQHQNHNGINTSQILENTQPLLDNSYENIQ